MTRGHSVAKHKQTINYGESVLGKQTRSMLELSLGQVTALSFLIGKKGVKLGPALQGSLAWVMRDDLYKVPELCV